MDSPDKPERQNRSPKLAEIKFETQAQIAVFLKEHREHLVIERRRKKLFLIATFKSIEDARNYIRNTNYFIWVCPDL